MISALIAVHNGAAFVATAIRSILRQTLPPDEIIVVDDGSTDNTADVVATFGSSVRSLRRTHGGEAAALNAGIAASKGEYLCFLDADDLWGEEKLARQKPVLEANPLVDAVFGQMVQFSDPHYIITEPGGIEHVSGIFQGAHKDAMLVRRATFDHIGLFDPTTLAGFPDWYARALNQGMRFEVLEEVVAFRRVHRSNETRLRRTELHRSYLKIARSQISRRASSVDGER